MTRLDADAIRARLSEPAQARLAELEAFAEIESTNSYLMRQDCPAPGRVRVALTDNQTMGRGRHGRTWQSPPGSGLCLSVAYTFSERRDDLPALTLAMGLGVIEALEEIGVSGIELKWPNDLIADNGKLGGILTEAQSQSSGSISVVTGLGLNVALNEDLDFGAEADQARRVTDLSGIAETVPASDELAARLIDGFCATFVRYEASGFAAYRPLWPGRDWLLNRTLTIDTPQRQISGIGAGIGDDGALLVNSGSGAVHRVTSGSVVTAGDRENGA